MEGPDRHGTDGAGGAGSDGRERVDGLPENGSVTDGPIEQVPVEEGTEREGAGAGVGGLDELQKRLRVKDQHLRELYEELAVFRVVADGARARAEAAESRVGDLEEERAELKEKLSAFEREERKRWRRREGQDRRVTRLERELERREEDIRRLEDLLEEKEQEMATQDQETQALISRKETALEDALRRVEGLERDLEERENEVAELKVTVDDLRVDLDLEYERRQRLAEPENRLRAGIDLFNESGHLRSVDSISKSLGQPEVHVALGEGDEPPVILTFTWGEVVWRTYAANPGLAVEEPRVYQMKAVEEPSPADLEPPNAHIGPNGRVLLGL